MKLSVVSGTRNRQSAVTAFVSSVLENTDVDFELIIADASTTAVEIIKDKRVRVLRERPRLGCSKGYNRAFKAALGEFVIWTNDDCLLLPNYASAAVDFMEQNPHVGLGCLRYREGRRDFHTNFYFGMRYGNFGVVRREFGNQIGWFDDDFEMYGSDNGLSFRVLLAGKGIAEVPHDSIIHYALDDDERKVNDDHAKRIAEVTQLARKYAPFIEVMRETYIATGGVISPRDQTPQFVNDIVQQCQKNP